MRKTRSRSGFTLSETLITLAILAIVTVAGTVASGTVLSTKIDMMQTADAQVLASTALKSVADEVRYGRNISIDPPAAGGAGGGGAGGAGGGGSSTIENNTITLDSMNFGTHATIELDDTDGRIKVTSGAITAKGDSNAGLLLPETAYTSLKVKSLNFKKDGADVTITVAVEGRQGELCVEAMTVTPLNSIK